MSEALSTMSLAQAVGVSNASTVRRLDGSTISAGEIDKTVNRLMTAARVTGTGIAILNDGKIVYLKAYGYRGKERKLPLTENSVMSAASFTKVAFAYMVMQLVEQRMLDLDKPVYQYLPKPLAEYPDYKDLANDPRYKLITARMLLSHTSGFPNWRRFNDDQKLNINFQPGSTYAISLIDLRKGEQTAQACANHYVNYRCLEVINIGTCKQQEVPKVSVRVT